MKEEILYKITVEKIIPRGEDERGYPRELKSEVYTQTVDGEDFDLPSLVRAVNWPEADITYGTTVDPPIYRAPAEGEEIEGAEE